jgi:hypothetical protein
MANGHRSRYSPAMDWIGWIKGPGGAALQWFEAHPGTASWLEAIGSITAIVFVYLFALVSRPSDKIARKYRSDQESAGISAGSYSRADRLQIENRSGYRPRKQTCCARRSHAPFGSDIHSGRSWRIDPAPCRLFAGQTACLSRALNIGK